MPFQTSTPAIRTSLAVLALVVIAGTAAPASHAQTTGAPPCPEEPQPVSPHPRVPAAVGESLFNQLIAWIALNTTYDLTPVYADPPTLSFCRVGEIIDYEHSDLLVDKALLAAFDRDRRHIFLTHPWSPLSYFDQSVLLHELIHDAQLQNREWDCAGAPEREAYLLQDKWLIARGIDHPFDWQKIARLSRCD